MKKLALMAFVLFVTAITAKAQTQPDTTYKNQTYPNQGVQNQDDSTWVSMGRTPEERAELSSMKIKRKLNLNDDQTAKIKAINLKKAMKADELRTKYKAQNNRTEKEPDFQALMDETNLEYKAILTPAQYTRWQEMEMKYKKNKMEKRQDKMDERKSNKTMPVNP